MNLTDSVALITGASSGIGAATARALADEGAEVVLAARREDRLEQLADEIGTDRAHAVPTDVTSDAEVDALVTEIEDTFGGPDVVVHSAGTVVRKPVAEQTMADLRQQVEVNLLGVMTVTRAALPSMIDAGGGDVVAISSINARHPAGGAYSATKFGVNGFCRGLRKEVADEGVRVTTVMPGPVVTEMRDWAEWDGRPLDPSEIAEAVVFALTRPDHVTLLEFSVHATDMELS